MKMNKLERIISALGLALCILCAGLIVVPDVAVKSTEILSSGIYHLMDENKPERV